MKPLLILMKTFSKIVRVAPETVLKFLKSFQYLRSTIYVRLQLLFLSRKLFFHYFIFSLFIFLCSVSVAQQTQVGIPWIGSPGITKTVNQLMSLEDTTRIIRFHVLREHETHLHKKKNPEAHSVSAYPDIDQTENLTHGSAPR